MQKRRNNLKRILFRGRFVIALAVGQLAAVGAMAAIIYISETQQMDLSAKDALLVEDPLYPSSGDEGARERYVESLGFDDE